MRWGFLIDRTGSEIAVLNSQTGWDNLLAVKAKEVYAVDGPSYFNRPGSRLVDGIELLASLLHPQESSGSKTFSGSGRLLV